MAKKKATEAAAKFRLDKKAEARLNTYLAQIKKGILNVCELHTHDSAPSLSKKDFEVAYIDKILGQTATAVSASIHAMTEGLQIQKQQELTEAIKKATEASQENKQEDKQ